MARKIIRRLGLLLLSAVMLFMTLPLAAQGAVSQYDGTWLSTSGKLSLTIKDGTVIMPKGEYKFSFYDTRTGSINTVMTFTAPLCAGIKDGKFQIKLKEIYYGMNSGRSNGTIKMYGTFTDQSILSIAVAYEENLIYVADPGWKLTLHKKGSMGSWSIALPDMDEKLAADTQCLNDALWDGKKYIIVGRGRILTSTDGKKWNVVYRTDFDHNMNSIVWTGKEYMAMGNNDLNSTFWVLKSTDGIKWKEYKLAAQGLVWELVTNGKVLVAGTSSGFYTSTDGIHWTKSGISGAGNDFGCISYANGYFVAAAGDLNGQAGGIYYSKDGLKWTKAVYDKPTGLLKSPIYMNGRFYLFDNTDKARKIISTRDFKTWQVTDINAAFRDNWVGLCMAGKNKISVMTGSAIMSTVDGTKWNIECTFDNVPINNMLTLNGKIFLVGPGTIYVSK